MGVRSWYIRRKFNKAIEPYDTERERNEIMETQIKRGMPEWMASGLSVLLGVIISALQTTDVSLLFTDPKAFGKMLLIAIVSRLLMQLQKPGTIVVEKKDLTTGEIVKTETVTK